MTQLTPAETKYFELLRSGMFFEFYPHLTGNISEDWEEWIVIYESLK